MCPCESLINRYLFYFFMENYWRIREQAVGGNQLNLSAIIKSSAKGWTDENGILHLGLYEFLLNEDSIIQ